jgi:hypothetical protein
MSLVEATPGVHPAKARPLQAARQKWVALHRYARPNSVEHRHQPRFDAHSNCACSRQSRPGKSVSLIYREAVEQLTPPMEKS